MLSISKAFRGAGQGEYYLNLSREDYYLSGGEPPGRWMGSGARALGLSGAVAPQVFRNLLQGYSEDGTTRLVHNAGSEKRRGGWDLTWSVPKSVSVAWSQAEASVRKEIEAAVESAVEAALHYLETIGVASRRGTDGVIKEPARLVFAAFQHSTSRAQDPQLHIHTVLINTGLRPDGSTGTLEPREIFRHQLTAGALFRAELAVQLERRLAFRARREGRCFEVLGVSGELIEAFSKRRTQIEAELLARGLSGARAAEVVAFDTRRGKNVVPREELFKQWHKDGREHGWTARELAWLMQTPRQIRNPAEASKAVATAAIGKLTDRQSHFSIRQLTQALAEEAQGMGIGATDVLNLRDSIIQSQSLVRLGSYRGECHWTTQEMIALERALLSAADAMRRKEVADGRYRTVIDHVLANAPVLSEEQRSAVRHVCEASGGLRVVSGMAGTGKSTLFAVANEVWRQQGMNVFGACLAGKAAGGLQEATGIRSCTIHRTLRDLDSGVTSLDSRSVLVIDEAGMVGTRQLARLVEACRATGATLVLCGDARQLQAIEAGGAFDALAKRHGSAELKEIRRQREAWARSAVHHFANGESAKALDKFESRGLLATARESDEAMRKLIRDWSAAAILDPAGVVILATTNADVYRLNALAQLERLGAKQLSGLGVAFGSERVFGGDRIVFTRNSSRHAVSNGDLGTVITATESEVSVKLDTGKMTSVQPAIYPHLRLGYALTVHKAQGMTAEAAFVFLDVEAQSRELSYVEASRARGQTRLYVAGHDLRRLQNSMGRSRQKQLATAVAEGPELELVMVR